MTAIILFIFLLAGAALFLSIRALQDANGTLDSIQTVEVQGVILSDEIMTQELLAQSLLRVRWCWQKTIQRNMPRRCRRN
ncbi:hypothetical protein ACFSHQ_00490 [Gemmobacter lanyuensis]